MPKLPAESTPTDPQPAIGNPAPPIPNPQTAIRDGKLLNGWPWLLAALSGVLLVLSLPPWNQGWLCWIALTPLICAVWFSPESARNRRRQAWLGYAAGLVFFTAAFYWLSALGTLFGSVWLKGLPLLLALYMALYLAAWAWLIGTLKKAGDRFPKSSANIATALLGASAWVSLEWIRGWLFSGFGWNGLGVALHSDLAMIQIVDVTGVYGLSFLIAFCNLMLVIVVRRLIAELGPVFLKRMRWEFSFTVALVAAVFSYGVRALLGSHPAAGAPAQIPVRIAAIQPNIEQSEKFSAESEDHIFEQLDQLTGLAAAAQPDLILWPEASTPRSIFADEHNARFVMAQAAKGDFSLLVGTVDFDPAKQEDYNSAVLISEGGKTLQSYRKMHLVPFGEYMPLRHSFPLFAWVAGELVPSDFTPGREFTQLSLKKPDVHFATLICFEDTLGDLTRRFVLGGASLLVNITNDGWFLKTAGAEQHLANAVFRAVENRRPMVRCANTGVTCGIDANGHVDRWLAPFESGFASREIRVNPKAPLTFYTRHGDWLAIGATLVTALHLASMARRRFQR